MRAYHPLQQIQPLPQEDQLGGRLKDTLGADNTPPPLSKASTAPPTSTYKPTANSCIGILCRFRVTNLSMGL